MSDVKKGMSGLDVKVCVDELTEILDAWTGKIYGIGDLYLLKLNHPEKGRKDLVIEPGRKIHLSSMKYDTPDHPPSFAMLLRKHLSGSKLVEIHQPDFERIVELEFERGKERRILIGELFGEGNLILCDEDRTIIQPQKRKSWKHRELRSDREYKLPPKKGRDISSIGRAELREALVDAPDLVRGLARNLNIGGELAEEICARADLEKGTDPDELSKSDLSRLHGEIGDLLSAEVNPQIVYEGGEPIQVTPFPFEIMRGLEAETYETFNQALDHYFQITSEIRAEEKEESRLEDRMEEVRARMKNQERHLEELEENARDARRKADAISAHHQTIDLALEELKEISKSQGWENIDEKIRAAADSDNEWAKLVKSVHPDQGAVVMDLPEETVRLDLRKSSFENASELYERSKRAKGKIEGAREAVEETREELTALREEGLEEVPEEPVPKKPRKRKWYERYRWFLSSDGMLAIAGRDVKTNQEVVEKHMEPGDRYLHADLKGAPHAVIKAEGREIPENTLREAARFAAMHSRAWREGLASADVYWVSPEQVSSEAPPGEYLPKGGYMIEGERNYLTVPLEAGVGLIEVEGVKIPMCGPPSAAEKHSDITITLKPGGSKKSDLAHEIKARLEEEAGREIDVDELMRILPPGEGMIV